MILLSKGLILSNGHVWSQNRRFALRVLKDFGFGKSSIADFIDIEERQVLEHFESKNGKPFAVESFLNTAVLNTLLQIVLGRIGC